MGYIQRREDRPKPWLARYRGPDGRHHSKSFRRKVDAEKWLHVEESKSIRGEWVDPTAGKIIYREWSERWLEGIHSVKPKTLAGYESLLRSRVLPVFAGTELRRISTSAVRSWVAAMVDEGLSPARIRQALQVLHASLAVAVDDGLIARNPTDRVKPPAVHKRRQLFLTADQVAKLAEAAESRQEGAGALVLILTYAGLRWGEVVALRWENIDTARRRVHIRESATEIAGRLEWGTPKTHEVRTVIVPDFVIEGLGEPSGGLVFTAPRGGPLRHSNFTKGVWMPACAASGMPGGLLIHDLRDTAASLAISAGASIKAVQRMLGHASAAMTLDTYGSLFDEDLEDLADRMQHRYGPGRDRDNVVRITNSQVPESI
jgi:integrase